MESPGTASPTASAETRAAPDTAHLAVVPLLARQEAVYRRFIVVAVVALVLPVLVRPFEPLPPDLSVSVIVGCIGSFAACMMAMRRHRALLVTSAVAGSLLAVAIRFGLARGIDECMGAFGIASMAVLWLWSRRASVVDRELARTTLVTAVLIPVFLCAAVAWTGQTERVLPKVFDAFLLAADTTLGIDSFHAGRIMQTLPWFVPIAHFVYDYQWPWLMCVWLRQLADREPKSDLMAALIWVTFIGVALFFVFPVVGPAPAFDEAFPLRPPPISALRLVPIVALPDLRNCMPSLHNAWAILAVWHARRYGIGFRVATWALLGVTMFATLGFGYHYAHDIVVACPVALIAYAASSRAAVGSRLGVRPSAIVVGSLLTGGWLFLLRYGVPLLVRTPGLTPVLALVTVATCIGFQRALFTGCDLMTEGRELTEPQPAARFDISYPLFLASGALGAAYVIAESHALFLSFGSTAEIGTTLGVALLGGLGAGALWGARVASSTSKSASPVRSYAYATVALAAACALAKIEMRLLGGVYVSFAAGSEASGAYATGLRVALEALVVVPAAVAMGATFPLLADRLEARRAPASTGVVGLGATGAFGAALGAALTAFVILPLAGSDATLLVAGGALLIALAAFVASARIDAAVPQSEGAPLTESLGSRAVILTLTGALTAATGVVSLHLLEAVVGESVGARSTSLVALVLGWSLGVVCSVWAISRPHLARASLALFAALHGLAILAMYRGVLHAPAYFASFAEYPFGRTFAEREYIRFLASLVLIAPAMGCLGGLSAVATASSVASGAPFATRAGRAAALVFGGGAAGTILVSLGLLPALGSSGVVELVAIVSIGLAASVSWALPPGQRIVPGLAVVVAGLMALLCFTGVDSSPLASGASLYFRDRGFGQIVTWSEGVAEGIVAVVRPPSPPGSRLPRLISNGVPIGDGSPGGISGHEYGLLPLMRTSGRHAALILGLGTGATSRAVATGFGHTDIVEPDPDVVRFARAELKERSGGVTEEPSVQVHVTDGKAFLLLSRASYDVISVAYAPPWTRRAAAESNVELLELARSRLAPRGVFEEALRLDHTEWPDVISVIATLRHVFPQVSLYARGDDAALLACASACPEALLAAPDDAASRGLEDARVLSPSDVDRLMSDVVARGVDVGDLLSTDDSPRLEWSSARGNALADDARDVVERAMRSYGARAP